MVKEKDTVSEATEELSESVHEVNKAVVDSIIAAQERNLKFAQSIMDDEVELFKSHVEGTQSVMEKLGGEPEKGPAFFQLVTESAVAAQERNVQFVQKFLEDGTEVLRSHVEDTRTLMHTLTEQSSKQREALGMLARGAWDAYRGFFPSPIRLYERAMETAESLTARGVETAEKVAHQEKPAVHSAKK